MTRKLTHYFILIIFLLLSCNDEIPEPANPDAFRPLTAQEKNLLNSSNSFSFELLRILNKQSPSGNIFFSPISIGNGIGMAINLINDKPKEELKNFLQITGMEDLEIDRAYYKVSEIIGKIDRAVIMNFGNSLWINNQYTISELTTNKLMAYYNAEVDLLNFTNDNSVKSINRWLISATSGKMTGIINHFDPADHAYILNTVDLDLSLALRYEQILIPGWNFILSDGRLKSCELIKPDVQEVNYYYADKISMIDIPLGSGNTHMIFLMPDDKKRMVNLLETINPGLITAYTAPGKKIEKVVIFPRININSEIRMKKIFPELGKPGSDIAVKTYFEAQDNFVSDLIHKSTFSVKSNGNETIPRMPLSMVADDAGFLQINRPFIIIIREEYTGGILFNGLINDPTED